MARGSQGWRVAFITVGDVETETNSQKEEVRKRKKVNGRCRGERRNSKEQITAPQKQKGMDPEHSPRGWSLSDQKRDSPSTGFSGL